MEYIEKDFPLEAQQAKKMGGYIKMPAALTKMWVKKNVGMVRAMMGGKSRDITSRPITVEDRMIRGYARDIRIRVYSPEGNKKRPLMVFCHGGGWVGGSVEAVEDYCKAVADRGDCVVLSVDYHLAPEGPFPEGVEDAYKALQWGVSRARELNIDEERVSVSGDSAGGNFAAVLSLMARERGDVRIDKQILVYPATDLTNMAAGPDKTQNAFSEAMLELYLEDMKKADHPHVSPAKCNNLTNMPKTLIAVGDLDFLFESSLAYSRKLHEAGNVVKFLLYRNTNHAFIDNTGNCPQAEDLIDEVARFL